MERDGGYCIVCGRPGSPWCHYIPRAHGGLGIAENIITLVRHMSHQIRPISRPRGAQRGTGELSEKQISRMGRNKPCIQERNFECLTQLQSWEG